MARAHIRGTIFHRYIFRTNICLLYSFYIYFTEEPGTQKTETVCLWHLRKKRSICLHANGCWPDNHIKNKQQIQN